LISHDTSSFTSLIVEVDDSEVDDSEVDDSEVDDSE
jgi:hypothetical protein